MDLMAVRILTGVYVLLTDNFVCMLRGYVISMGNKIITETNDADKVINDDHNQLSSCLNIPSKYDRGPYTSNDESPSFINENYEDSGIYNETSYDGFNLCEDDYVNTYCLVTEETLLGKNRAATDFTIVEVTVDNGVTHDVTQDEYVIISNDLRVTEGSLTEDKNNFNIVEYSENWCAKNFYPLNDLSHASKTEMYSKLDYDADVEDEIESSTETLHNSTPCDFNNSCTRNVCPFRRDNTTTNKDKNNGKGVTSGKLPCSHPQREFIKSDDAPKEDNCLQEDELYHTHHEEVKTLQNCFDCDSDKYNVLSNGERECGADTSVGNVDVQALYESNKFDDFNLSFLLKADASDFYQICFIDSFEKECVLDIYPSCRNDNASITN